MQCACKHGLRCLKVKVEIFMVAAECECFPSWGCTGGITVWVSLEYIWDSAVPFDPSP